ITRCLRQRGREGVVLPSLRRGEEQSVMLGSLGALYSVGYEVDWNGLYPAGGRCIRLPSYPWQRERYWAGSQETAPGSYGEHTWRGQDGIGHHPLSDRHMAPEVVGPRPERPGHDPHIEENPDEWLYELRWQPRARLPEQQATESAQPVKPGSWLIFADSFGAGAALAAELASRGQQPVLVFAGNAYERLSGESFRVRATQPEDFPRLLEEALGPDRLTFRGVIHLWSVDAHPPEEVTAASLEAAQTFGCGSVLRLVQALSRSEQFGSPRLWLVTRGAQPVEEKPSPLAVAQHPLWGFGRVIAQEHPRLWGGLIDLDPATPPHDAALQLWEEISAPDGEPQLTFRHGQRYVARLARQSEPFRQSPPFTWRPDGSYL